MSRFIKDDSVLNALATEREDIDKRIAMHRSAVIDACPHDGLVFQAKAFNGSLMFMCGDCKVEHHGWSSHPQMCPEFIVEIPTDKFLAMRPVGSLRILG